VWCVLSSKAEGFTGRQKMRCEVGSLFPAFYIRSDDKMDPNMKEFLGKTSSSFRVRLLIKLLKRNYHFWGLLVCSASPRGGLPERSTVSY